MIRRVLIVDTETTGLDPTKDDVIEVGAVLYSVEHGTTLAQFSILSTRDSNPAEAINRIPSAALTEHVIDPDVSHVTFSAMIDAADAYVAHNAEFDAAFLPKWRGKPWLCSKDDFAWPLGKPGSSLVSLALDHGIGVASAHRALTDCQLIAALFDRMALYGQDLQAMFAHAMRPKARFRALVPIEQKDLAKNAGFKWNEPIKGQWTRVMAIEDVEKLPFRCARV